MKHHQISLSNGIHEYSCELSDINLHFTLDKKDVSRDLIIFIHGLGCSSESFKNVFDKNYFANESIMIPDLPGFGKSKKPSNFSYRMENFATVVEELVNKLPFTNFHIIGHSMGGAIGLLFSDNFFKNVKSLVSIEGNLIDDDCRMFSSEIISTSFQEYSKRKFPFGKEMFNSSKMLLFDETSPEAMYKSAESLVSWSVSRNLLDKFLSMVIPKAYFYGDKNKNIKVLNYLSGVEKFMISNSGHEVMMDNPTEFFGTLKYFLQKSFQN